MAIRIGLHCYEAYASPHSKLMTAVFAIRGKTADNVRSCRFANIDGKLKFAHKPQTKFTDSVSRILVLNF